MRILIACPPICDFYSTPHRMAALGTEVLKNRLKQHGHIVTKMNFPAYGYSTAVPLPRPVSYLKPFIIPHETGPVSFFTQYKRFGPDFPVCAQQIVQEQPDLVCISLFAWAYAEEAVELSAAIKILRPRLPVICGGSGLSAFPEYFMKEKSIDFVITGEGDRSLVLLCALLEKTGTEEPRFFEIPGLFWKQGTEVCRSLTPQVLNNEPQPAIVKTTTLNGKPFFSVSLARGCPKQCRFCTNFIVQGRRFRKAPLQSVKERFLAIKNQKSVPPSPLFPHFNFEDDNLLVDPDYFMAVLQICKDIFPQASFSAENGLDYQLLTLEFLEILKCSGFTQLNLSLASVSDSILKKQGRRLALDRYTSIVKRAAELEIHCITYFIAGFPEDTPESIAEALGFLAVQPTQIGISPFYAVPGLPGFEDDSRFRDLSPRLSLGSSMYPWNNSLSTRTLVTAFRLARLINCVKRGRRISQFVDDCIEQSFQKKMLFTIVRENKEKKLVEVENMDEKLLELFFSRCSTPRAISYQ
ncbi:MAG: radical SAM protein [Spirochaetales bacterium]|nr:radical SAM protein [Spirochaetales bacterium]